MINKFSIVVTSIIVVFLVVGVTHAKSETIEKSFAVKSGGTFYLKSDSGSIEIESHGRDMVEIEVEKKGRNIDDFVVEFSQDGNDVRVSGERDGSYFKRSANVHFLVKIPKDYNVNLKTGGGSIELADLKGTVDAKTSGGSISLGRIEGDVDVDTSGGSIRVDEVAGNIDAHTSGGSIKAKITKQPTADCRLTTSGGSVTVYLAPEIAVDLDASTSGGSVSSELDVTGKIKPRHIKGTINGGGPDLELHTSGGSVRVKSI